MTEQSDWVRSSIRFKVGGREVKFKIIHNLKSQGYEMETVLDNWFPRAKNFTDKELVGYINSKSHMTNCFAMTIEEYESKLK